MKHYFLFLAVGALTLLGSCKTQGCTDPFADNYDAAAEENDGSCSYSTELVLYLSEARKAYWDDKPEFYAPFHFYIGDEKIGELSVSAASFQTYEYADRPDCATTTGGIFKFTHTMEQNIGDLTIKIQDQLGNSHGSIFIYTTNGECQAVLI